MEQELYRHALVVGGTGGIGSAFIDRLGDRRIAARVSAWARRPPPLPGGNVDWHLVDVLDEGDVQTAAAALEDVDLVLVATGMLHQPEPSGTAILPEKTMRRLDPAAMAQSFAINAIAPAIIAKHVLPKFPRDRRAVFAALSARVGSIGDNRLGGWYSYRASKAALNQILKTLSIELAVTHPLAICVGLHPGTVDSALSQPFKPGIPADRLTTPAIAVARLLTVISDLTPANSGKVFDWQGKVVPD